MGTRAREIIGMDVDKLLKLLNAAYASEWLAYYQYWLGAKVIKGPPSSGKAGIMLNRTKAILAAGTCIDWTHARGIANLSGGCSVAAR